MSYYITTTSYVGPDYMSDDYVDADTIEIRTQPRRTNQTGEELASGYLGTTNNWSRHAYGEYPTIEAAREYVEHTLGPVRELNGPVPDDPDVVAVYAPDEYPTVGDETLAVWASMWADKIAPETTHDDLREYTDQLIDALMQSDTPSVCDWDRAYFKLLDIYDGLEAVA